ncbi:uncharacterized protein DNG_05522 [Cephalotrichum gorgonifer]|uniref:Uncharacterized protein n=1 Tax=Cephalotrichum gorgonifer TaxID=2041049 RepID=A0AAE8MY13_9PEZI|nr:uncharacterized protein DNG_05522 [Cephalotrichum gorgonifer]
MGHDSYSDEETIHHDQVRATRTAKFFHRASQVMLFLVCLTVLGGIVMGIVGIHNTAALNASKDTEEIQAPRLLVRYHFDNATVVPGTANPTGTAPVTMANATAVSGAASPTGTAPVSMDNATLVMNTASGAVPSDSPSSGYFSAAQVSTEVNVSAAIVNITTTVTSTSTTVTNTRTITPSGFVTVDSVASSSGGVGSDESVSTPASDCVPATVTLTVTETVVPDSSAQVDPNIKTGTNAVVPFTTIVIPDLYSKIVQVGQPSAAAVTPNSTAEATTVTIFEQPVVILTSTVTAEAEASSFTTSVTGMGTEHCASENVTAAAAPSLVTVTLSKVVTEIYTTTLDGSETLMTEVNTVFATEVIGVEETVYATNTIQALNATMTPHTTITVQPANPVVTQQAPSSSDSAPVVVSEGSLEQGKRGGSSVTGCVVMVVAIFFLIL